MKPRKKVNTLLLSMRIEKNNVNGQSIMKYTVPANREAYHELTFFRFPFS